MKDIIIDTLLDGVKLIPFLLFTFIILELIEHKFKNKTEKIIRKSGKFGPLIGSLLGIFPQCGFSVAATNFYTTRIISLGTLIAIYLSTSDEMLPIMLSEKTDIKIILIFLIIKLFVGIIFGFIVDFIFRNSEKNKFNYNICEEEHCHCEHGLLNSSIVHTFKTFIYILISTFIINILFSCVSTTNIEKIFFKNNIFGPFIGSLFGLIPNCGASILLTELFINNTISLGTCLSGLLTGSGVALLVLFRTNKNLKDNLKIVSILYTIGLIVGIFIDFLHIII